MNLRFVRYSDLARVVGSIRPIEGIGAIYGVPRSGMVPASMLAMRWGVPLGMAGSSSVVAGGDRLVGHERAGDRVLLVDDSLLTGRAMERAKAALVDSGVAPERIVTLAVFVIPGKEEAVDHFAVRLAPPRIFEWNLWNNDLARNVMFDLDGVMCYDPEVFDDDGEAYESAIVNAVPRFLPTRPIHSIVTNRIERWRGHTEAWLSRHGVRFGELVMQPHPTAAERRAYSDPVAYKATRYASSDAWLYVESHDRIAHGIAQRSNRPVFSVQSGALFRGSN